MYKIHEAITAFLTEETQSNYINNGQTRSFTDTYIPVLNPATEEFLTAVPDSNSIDADFAISSAEAGLKTWRKCLPLQREKILLDIADTIEANGRAIADLLVLEQGKLLKDAHGEVSACVNCFRYYAGWATKIEGSVLETSLAAPNTEFFAFTKREPVGIVAAIAPWNVPVMMFGWKVAPALACGCVVILKPSEFTPLTSLYIASLIAKTKLPEGVLAVLTGYGHTIGDYLVKNKRINKISFTGSGVVGKRINKNATENLTRVTLELGGKNPIIVLKDADMSKVIAGVTRGVLYNQGQVCVSGSRIYLPNKDFEKNVSAIADALTGIRVGEGFDAKAQLGPLVSEPHFKKVMQYIENAKKEAIELVAGGEKATNSGYFVQPTLYANPYNNPSAILRDEVFGPVLIAMPYDDIEQVIAYANDSDYGLSASIWTENISHAHQLINQIQAGVIFVNSAVRSDTNLPLGGFKQSGIGRELGKSAIEQYTEVKSVCIAY